MLGFFIVKLDFFFWTKLQFCKEELVYWPATAPQSEIFKPLMIWYSHMENSVGYKRASAWVSQFCRRAGQTQQDFSLFNFFQDFMEVGMKDMGNVCMTSIVSLGEGLVVGFDQFWWLSSVL